MRSSLWLAACLVALCSPRAEAACHLGPDMDWKQGKLGRLSSSIGTYHYEILDNEVVKARLTALAGTLAPVLRQNLEVTGPISFTGTSLVLAGLQAHGGGSEESLILVRPCDGLVQAALLHDGLVYAFKGSEDLEPEVFAFASARAAQAKVRILIKSVPEDSAVTSSGGASGQGPKREPSR